jgi:hypothetical protein
VKGLSSLVGELPPHRKWKQRLLKRSDDEEKTMRKALAAAVAVGLAIASNPTYAGDYVVNGHAASPEEAQLLVSYGAASSRWMLDGFAISPADNGHGRQRTPVTVAANAGTSSMCCSASD